MDQSLEHIREISNTLYKYHLDNFLCDVFIITPDGSEVPAHSIVLSAVSVKLRAAFEKSDNTLKKNYVFRLYVSDSDTTTVEMVLQFIYTGSIVMSPDTSLDITHILSAGQKLGLDANKLATFLGALLLHIDASIMENLPPVILTDEDICLEIVEKGSTKHQAVEIIKIKSKHNDLWGLNSDGHDHSYINGGPSAQRRRPRQPKIADLEMLPMADQSNVEGRLSEAEEDEEQAGDDDGGMMIEGEYPMLDIKGGVVTSVKSSACDGKCPDGLPPFPAAILEGETSGVAAAGQSSYEVYGAMFAPESDLDGITTGTTVIKSEAGLEENDRLLHEVLMKTVVGGGNDHPEVKVIITPSGSGESTSFIPQEKRKRGRKPQLVHEKIIHICEFKDCGRSFRRLREYINHYRTHTGEKPYVCDICGKAFIRSYAVTEHRRVHTGERPYVCDICGRQFTVGGDLNKHKRLHAGEVLYRCKICGKEMNTGRENADHRRMHEGGIFCPHCGKPFTRLHNMKEHVRIAHTGDKNYACRDCGKQFAYARNLRYHRRLHKTDRPFKCETCGKCFAAAGELSRHERSTHKAQIQVLLFTQPAEEPAV